MIYLLQGIVNETIRGGPTRLSACVWGAMESRTGTLGCRFCLPWFFPMGRTKTPSVGTCGAATFPYKGEGFGLCKVAMQCTYEKGTNA